MGIIYIQNCEFNEEIKKKIKDGQPSIEKAVEASFINSRNPSTMADFLTFHLQEQPYSIYISVQPSHTAIYKYEHRPMICHNGYKHRLTKAQCRRKGVRRNFGNDDHKSDKLIECSNEYKCLNCGEGHMAESNACQMEQKEKVLKKPS